LLEFTSRTIEEARTRIIFYAFSEVLGTAATPGYDPAQIRIACINESEHLERRIKLTKLAPKKPNERDPAVVDETHGLVHLMMFDVTINCDYGREAHFSWM
jgi:hypothetical protein